MARPNTYAIGQTAILEGKTVNEGGEPVAPDNPQILLKHLPSGVETSLAVESVTVGTWFHRLYLTGPVGLYTYRLVTDTDAEERSFYVEASTFEAPLGVPAA